jgi:hypothetical protein
MSSGASTAWQLQAVPTIVFQFNQKVVFAPDVRRKILGIAVVQLPSSRKLLYERFAMPDDG